MRSSYKNSGCQYLKAGIKAIFLVLLALQIFSSNIIAQSFTYTSPVCSNFGITPPVKSPNFPSFGTYSATPAGLNFSSATGSINVSFSAPGSYTISYFGSNCSCVLTATILIHPIPSVSIYNATICAGTPTAAFTASPSSGLTYTWQPGGGNSVINIVPAAQVTQIYTVNVTDANGCSNKAVKQGTVFSGPSLFISGTNSICAGGTVQLFASGSTSYTWSTGAIANFINITPTVTTTFSVSSKSANGCVSTATKTVAFNSQPTVTVNDTTVCSGKPLMLIAQVVPNDGVSFLWLPDNLNGSAVTVTPSSTKNYSLFVTRAGCTSTAILKVNVIKSSTSTPVFTYNYNNNLCLTSASIMPIKSQGFSEGGVFNSGDLNIDSVTGSIRTPPVNAGFYNVTYSVAAQGCTTAASSSVTIVFHVPGKLVVTPDISIAPGTSTFLNASGADNYSWNNQQWLSCSDCPNPVANPPESTLFCVASTINYCYVQACIHVEVLCKNGGDLTVPNAFTPNNDANNDQFCLQGWKRCNTFFKVMIFNRWGEKVFESDDPSFCWDGTFNGSPQNSGVFAYSISASFNNEPEIIKSGNISLIR